MQEEIQKAKLTE